MNLKNQKTFNSIYFRDKNHFENNDTQSCFVFQTVYRYFKIANAIDSNISSWKSKGLSDESIKSPSTCNEILNPSVDYVSSKSRVKFYGDCLKQEKITFNHRKVVNIYIVYEI